MSLLGKLFESLTGKSTSDFTPPNSLCPGSCPIGPGACTECQPYKERLKEALYNVDHLEEFNARYEIVSETVSGTVTCPHCGAPSSNRMICDYCGMQIAEDDGKIRVSSASEIPDPIIVARDIIYERHSKISALNESGSSDSLLTGLTELLSGSSSSSVGKRMSREEILEAASLYDVSVSSYLNGLDNGVYLSLDAKKKSDAAATAVGVGTAAGLGSTVFSAGTPIRPADHNPPPRPPVQPQLHQQMNPRDQRKDPVHNSAPRPQGQSGHEIQGRPQVQTGHGKQGQPQGPGRNSHGNGPSRREKM